MEKSEIKAELEQIPKKHLERSLENYKRGKDISDLELQQDLLRQQTYESVEAEVDTDGKKVFSNQEKRNSETERRLRSSPTYTALVKQIMDMKTEYDTNMIVLKNLEMRNKNANTLGSIWVVEANRITPEDRVQ